jgi:hypothetical protein
VGQRAVVIAYPVDSLSDERQDWLLEALRSKLGAVANGLQVTVATDDFTVLSLPVDAADGAAAVKAAGMALKVASEATDQQSVERLRVLASARIADSEDHVQHRLLLDQSATVHGIRPIDVGEAEESAQGAELAFEDAWDSEYSWVHSSEADPREGYDPDQGREIGLWERGWPLDPGN